MSIFPIPLSGGISDVPMNVHGAFRCLLHGLHLWPLELAPATVSRAGRNEKKKLLFSPLGMGLWRQLGGAGERRKCVWRFRQWQCG